LRVILKKEPIRGVSAIAERPDGAKVNFTPYPAPLFAPDGTLCGAVNILIDITDQRQAESLHVQAARCRRLAGTIRKGDEAVTTLNQLADECSFVDAAALGDLCFRHLCSK
jgi:hypothetical protein